MATIIQALTFNLATPIDATQTSIPVRNLKDSRGTAITSLAGVVVFATIEPRSSANQEIISFTGVTDNGNGIVTLTGVTRNLNPQSPYTTLGGLVPHSNNAECILSNNPPFYNDFIRTDSNVTITGNIQFPTPTLPTNAATKSYVDGIAFAGAPDATGTSKGVTRLSLSPNVTLGNPTITIASPAVITLASHGLTVDDTVIFTTTGALPTGILASVPYYVIATGLTANDFQISATAGGAAINTSGGQSGTHTLVRSTPRAVGDNDPRIPTANQSAALAGAGAAPTGANKFLTQGDVNNNTLFPVPVLRLFTQTTQFGSSTTQFDISLISGTTYRYTWDGTGTDPTINTTTVPIGTMLYLNGQNFAANNKGYFTVTGSGVNYFEITNAAGSVENNVTLGTGFIYYAYIPPAGVKYVEVELVGSGGNGANDGAGGGAGGYARKIFTLAALGSGKYFNLRVNGVGGNSIFDSILTCGNGANASGSTGGTGGSATGGDINIAGQNGQSQTYGGGGGDSVKGFGGKTAVAISSTAVTNGHAAGGYGGGGGGGTPASDGSPSGGAGAAGTQAALFITEYYS